MARGGSGAIGMRGETLRGSLAGGPTKPQMEALTAYVAAGGSVQDAAELVGIRLSTVKRHLADLCARSGSTTEQLIYTGRARLAHGSEPRAQLNSHRPSAALPQRLPQ